MKKLIYKIIFVLVSIFFIPGCYTVIWSPEKDFPDEENYYSSEPDNYYYYSPGYSYFYDYPWWLAITPPSFNSGGGYERDREMTNLRNSGGRNNEGTSGINNTAPPLRNRGGDNNTGNNSGSNNSGSTRSTSTENTTSSSSTSRDNSKDTRTSRDDTGGRNNGNGRR